MGVTHIKANYQVTANDNDITSAIARHFVGLRTTDETGINSDTLEIILDDTDQANPIKIPPRGAELRVAIGWDQDPLTPMGLFVCDEIEVGGWPSFMTIRARAAIYEATPKGKKDLQTQKARRWANGTKLGAMVAKIAKEHGMESVVSASLASITLPHFDQTEESDISFLLRVARRYDAIVKPAGGKLVMTRRGDSSGPDGQALPVVTIMPSDVESWTMTRTTREQPGTVIAYWHSTMQSKRIMVQVGGGDPVKRLRQYYPTQDAAMAAAEAEYKRRQRGQIRFSCKCKGDTGLTADSRLLLPSSGWREGVAGEWLINRVEHVLDASGGYCSSIDAEIPVERAESDDE